MNQLYQDAGLLPLFGVESREVARTTNEGTEISWLDRNGFEKDRAWFWFGFEHTIGWLLAEYIELKSYRIALQSLSQPEAFVGSNSNSEDLLTQVRQGFGSKRATKLFQMRTRGFNASSPLMQHFCENVALAEALDDVYNARGSFSLNGQRIYPLTAPPDSWSDFYLNCPNAQAVRNRYRQVARLYEQFGGGRTLSIACGSAQPLIHAIHALKMNGQSQGVELVLTDISQTSLDIARQRAEQAKITDQVSYHKASFASLPKLFAGEKFDVVEACGILDYLPDEHVVALVRFALASLTKEGRIIVSNMSETRGAQLLRKTYNWSIRYRTPERLGQLIKAAGGKDIEVFIEPWGIHPVATAKA